MVRLVINFAKQIDTFYGIFYLFALSRGGALHDQPLPWPTQKYVRVGHNVFGPLYITPCVL